jgi:anti-sigma factor RsiW
MTENKKTYCQSLLVLLSDYVDGELSDELCQIIENHVAGCQNCHVVVDTLRKTISLYHDCADEPTEVPGEVRRELYRTLKLEDYLQPKNLSENT